MYDNLQDVNWLREQYEVNCRTAQNVADEIGCNRHTVLRALKRLGIERRKRTSKFDLLADKEWLRNAYVVENKSIKQIALEAGTTAGNVHSQLSRLGIRTRTNKEAYDLANPEKQTGANTGNWRGGRRIQSGYVFVYAPDHPYAVHNVVQEHRLVMEKELGRYLEPYEVVHHLDGDRLNNDPSNLEVKTRGRHISEHFKASHEVLELRQRVLELEAELATLRAQLEGR